MDSTISARAGRFTRIDPDTGEFTFAPFLRTAYNYDTDKASDESGLACLEPTLTQQQFRDEVDINTIVRNFGLTGQLPEQGAFPAYSDFENVPDYQTAMNLVRASGEAFMALPAEVRFRFNNDPQKLMEFVADDKNAAEAKSLGLTRTLLEQPKPQPSAPLPQAGIPVKPGAVLPDGTLQPDPHAPKTAP